MKAIILAAGRGSRLAGLTDDQPKCLISVGGISLLERQLKALRKAGIVDIGLVSGYLAHRIQVSNVQKFDNPRWQETNMVMSLVCANDWITNSNFIVSYSDIIYNSAAIDALLAFSGDIVITYDPNWRKLWEMRFDHPLDDAETFRVTEDGILLEIGDSSKDIDNIQGQFMGLLKFTSGGWRTVELFLGTLSLDERDRLDMTSMLSGLLSSGIKIHAVAVSDPWFEIDSERDLAVFESFLAQ
jgi:choline kinase